MSVLRNKRKINFSNIPNELIEDTRLSSNAFRIMCYLLTKPDMWTVVNSDISKRTGVKDPKTLSKCFKELLENGWVERERVRNDKGELKGGYNYILSESPLYPNTDKSLIRKESILGENGETNISNTNLNSNTNKVSNNKEKKSVKTPPVRLTKEQMAIKSKVGVKGFKLLQENSESFKGLGREKILLFIDWMAYRYSERKVPIGTIRVLKSQLTHFHKNGVKVIQKAMDLAKESGGSGWIDIKYAFEKVLQSQNGNGFKQAELTYTTPVYAGLKTY